MKNYLVSIKEGVPFQMVLIQIEEAGVEIVQEMENVGVIVIKPNNDNDINKLLMNKNISAVEQEKTIQLPPPDSKIQ